MGDRMRQVVNSSAGSGQAITTTYTLDLNAGLTQVLADGTNTYLYGNGRLRSRISRAVFQFTGEMRDATGLTYLRARYLCIYETAGLVGQRQAAMRLI